MIKKEKPWWRCVDQWALVLFVMGAWVLSGSNQLRRLGMFLVLVCVVKYFHTRTKWKAMDHPPEVFSYTLWGIWTGVTGMIVCFSPVFFSMNYRVLLQMIVMIWAIYSMLRMRMSDRLLYWTIIVGCVIQIVAVRLGYSFVKAEGIVSGEESLGDGRVSGLMGNTNALGFAMVAGVQCAIQLWRMKRSQVSLLLKGFLIVFVVTAAYVTFATGSRKTTAGMLILIVGWLVWLMPQSKGGRTLVLRICVVAVLLTLGGSLLAFVFNNTEAGKRFSQLFDRGGGNIAVGVEEDIRADMYRAGLRMFAEHPIAGVGLGQFQLLYWKGAYSHSDYIEPLACTGLVGFLFYHGFKWFLLLRIIRLRRHVRDKDEKYKINGMLLTLFVSFLLGFGSPYWSGQRHYILFTIFVAYTWMLEKKVKMGGGLGAGRPMIPHAVVPRL